MLQQAPWLPTYDIVTQLRPVVQYLALIGVTNIERVLRAYPQVLLAFCAFHMIRILLTKVLT